MVPLRGLRTNLGVSNNLLRGAIQVARSYMHDLGFPTIMKITRWAIRIIGKAQLWVLSAGFYTALFDLRFGKIKIGLGSVARKGLVVVVMAGG